MILQLDRALDLTFDRVAACATIADWPARVGLDATRGAQMGGVRPPPPGSSASDEPRWPRLAWLAEAPPWRRSVRRDPRPPRYQSGAPRGGVGACVRRRGGVAAAAGSRDVGRLWASR